MSLLTVAWSMCGSACFMIGLMHLMFGLGTGHAHRFYLLSSLMAVSAGFVAFTELGLLQTDVLATYSAILRWQIFVLSVLLVAMVWFIYLYLGTARLWLAVCITALLVVSFILNFLSPENSLFSALTELRRIPTPWGEPFSVPVGTINPWKYWADVASLLIVLFIADASVRAWRKGDRRRALTVGGSSTFFIVVAGIHTPLVDVGLINTPYMISFAFLAIVVSMSIELVRDAVVATRLKTELQSKENRWRDVLENLNMAVIGSDVDGRITYVNPYFDTLSGYESQQLIGRRAAEVVRGLDDTDTWEPSGATTRRSSPGKLITKTGTVRDLAWSTVRLRQSDGSSAGVLGIGEDVTRRLEVQRELRQLEREMEHLTRAGMLGELASGLAHELSQPLGAILNNAQAGIRLLHADPPDLDEVGEILSDIVRDDKRAGEVIHGLRAMLRKGEAQREILSLSDLVEEVVDLLRGEFLAYATKLRFVAQTDSTPVRVGRVALQQVVMNLAINAMRAVADVPVEVREVLIITDRGGDEIRLYVEDNGPGIPEAQLSHVFEPFFTTRSGGLGMGLPICRQIVEAHGGRIWIEKRDQGGARVAVSLPRSKDQLQSNAAQDSQ